MDVHKNSSCLSLNHNRDKMMILFKTNIESLPDEILFHILLHLPVEVIHEVIRFVCWKWNQTIRTRDFVHEHLKHRSNGLLISAESMGCEDFFYRRGVGARVYPWTYVSMRQQSIEICTVNCTFINAFWTSCNGLLLQVDTGVHNKLDLAHPDSAPVYDRHKVALYYIENPITRRRFYVPIFISPTFLLRYMHSGLGYAKDYYKVAVTYCKPKDDYYFRFSEEQDCAILTVGVDNSWRHVHTDHLSSTAKTVLDSIPLVTEGFLHWYGGNEGVVVTLNVDTETLKEFHVPQGYGKRWKQYFSTGTRCLSFVVSESKLSWEAWEMKPETGEWTRLPKIDLEAKKHLIAGHGCSTALYVEPIGWLKYTEVMVFNIQGYANLSKNFLCYDVHTQKIYPFKLKYVRNHSVAHVNSLVYLD